MPQDIKTKQILDDSFYGLLLEDNLLTAHSIWFVLLLADMLCQISDGTGTGQEVPKQGQQTLPLSCTQSNRPTHDSYYW